MLRTHTRTTAALATALLGPTLLATASSSGAGAAPPPLDVDLTSGPARAFVNVAGDGCEIPSDPADAGNVAVWFYKFADPEDIGYSILGFEAATDGTWSIEFSIPDSSIADVDLYTPGDGYYISATCTLDDGTEFAYAAAPFTIQEDPTLRLNPTTGPVGTRVALTGTGCTDSDGPGAIEGTITSMGPSFGYSSPLDLGGGVPVSADGDWTVTITIPATINDPAVPTSPGTYDIAVTCDLSGNPGDPFASATFTVTSPGPTDPATTPGPATAVEEPPPYSG
jgi:hypothetical protein